MSDNSLTEDIQRDIERALRFNAKLDAEALDVSTSDGNVTIEGTVSSWAEHAEAIAAAWAAPGVIWVHDRMTIA